MDMKQKKLRPESPTKAGLLEVFSASKVGL